MRYKTPYIDALLREMDVRKAFFQEEMVETIYFGGGTPSQLTSADFKRIFEQINRLWDTSQCREITLEVNPDDIASGYLSEINSFPFNRISMGVQSFNQEELDFLNRRHTKEQAIEAIHTCKQAGYTNLSIDLIYGLPGQTLDKWQTDLDEFLSLDIPHLSAYHLIYEQNTALYRLMEAGKVKQIEEEESLMLFSLLIDKLTAAGYEHYEISNFSRPGYISRHNRSYWIGTNYLGLGPSAHSYTGSRREWNVSSLIRYIEGMKNGNPVSESEDLDLQTRYNDFIITRLRTAWGVDYNEISRLFGEQFMRYCQKQAAISIREGTLVQKGNIIYLSRKGLFISDSIMSDLLYC